MFLSLPGTQPSQAGRASLLSPLTSCAVTWILEKKAATSSQLVCGRVDQPTAEWEGDCQVCHTAPGCRVTGGWGKEAPLGLPDRASCPPSSSEQLCFGDMLGTCPEIRELLLCFPFGFYPYVQDSLDRKAGRQGGEQ